MNLPAVREYLTGLQDQIVAELERLDGGRFRRATWTRPEGGGGDSRVIEESDLLERGGVNFSHVTGGRLPQSASALRPELAGRAFEAMGISVVLHPRNPFVPTVHLNVRSFVATDESQRSVWWFGGGTDLTPYYGFEEDAEHFHRACRRALEPFGADLYPRFKRWCDEYFYLRHRGEPRGIGGIFFDDLNTPDFTTCFAIVRSVGDSFLPAYMPIVERRRNMAFGEPRTRLPGIPPRPLRRVQSGL